jgi:pyocin large subunit-like protein
LPDHFARHGADFGARSPEDYAAQAAAFLLRAKAEGLPAKRDADGSLRIYDPSTGAFGAYNANGTTRTYFKPGSPTYFERQPGENVDLRKGQ